MPATTAAPVPYLNPTFDPTPPKPAATSLVTEPAPPKLPARKPTQPATSTTLETEPAPPKPPARKPAPPRTPTSTTVETEPASPKLPAKKPTQPATCTSPVTEPAPPKPPAKKPTPPKTPTTDPAPPNAPGTTPAKTTGAPTPPESLGTKPSPPTAPTTALAPPKAPNPAHTLGRRGEDLVAKYVQTRGLIVLCRNWRCREGEIDIVATDGHTVVICEVKTRTTDEYGTPADAMSAKKIRCIKAATNRWLREFRVPYVPLRYDLAEVWWPSKGKPHLQYRRDAF